MTITEQECSRWLEIAARAEIGTLAGDIEHMNAIEQALASAPKHGRVGMTGREWILIAAMNNAADHAGLWAHYQARLREEAK